MITSDLRTLLLNLVHLFSIRKLTTRRRSTASMHLRNGEIHLADLVVALDSLPWKTEAHSRAIAGCLGFGLSAPDVQPTKSPNTVYDRRQGAKRSPPVPAASAPNAVRAPPSPPIPVALPREILQSTFRELEAAPGDVEAAPLWLAQDYELLEPDTGSPPPMKTLLPANSARGVLCAALGMQRLGNELNVRALILSVVAGQLPTRLPRRPGVTLSTGCQLLLDFSDTMTPWWEDLRNLSGQVSAVVGETAVTVFDFETTPTTAGRWDDGEQRKKWEPIQNTPVLIATDLSVRGVSARQQISPEWEEFIRSCEKAHAPLVILTPWPRSYWPEGLGEHPYLVHWNPRTSATMVRQAVGMGHRARR